MSAHLNHIFDPSACFTRRQLKDYLHGNMTHEEQYAAEHHLNSCMLCSSAMDGMIAHGDVTAVLDTVSHSFLKEHFIQTSPQVHLNSIAIATPAAARRSKAKAKGGAFVKPSTVAAALLLSIGALWYFEYGRNIQYKPVEERVVAAPAEAEDATPGDGEQLFATTRPETALTVIVPEEQAPASQPQQSNQQPPQAVTPAVAEYREPVKKEQPKQQSATQLPKVSNKLPVTPQPPAGTTHLASDEQPENKEAQKTGDAPPDSGKKDERKAEESAESLFDSGEYGAALRSYKKQMQSGNERTRQDAMLMAARCYMNLGKKGSAVELLEALASNGSGSPKRTARRMLRQMEN